MIELHVILRARPNQTRSMTAALQALAKSARMLQGCVNVEVYKNVAQPRYLCYDEVWESETELRHMIASHHFSQLAALMELSSEPPSCEFRFISQTYGLGFAEQVRGHDNV
ncbi:antibiotic biosynthesis monooxygenase [Methylomonas sp. MO1]|uniref:putative quinol monooxygenase n=1 Tax=Methylomonas sp. MO1 TaxID=3073619 RepID=UPI0028A394B6|nr:antibiotic biosynthesis monooxygenase [Methylomonas sp. MO1]MDT4290336.1 antibiotic biosynthesis monooxygenase [Methylomonas sp. MO1]